MLIGAFMLSAGMGRPAGDFALFAALSGVAGSIGLAAFYRGLAVGNMGVVAPISSTAAVDPRRGRDRVGRPAVGDPVRRAGAGAHRRGAGVARGGLREARTASGAGFAMLCALGFGFFFVGMDNASDADIGWAMLGNRITGFSLLLRRVRGAAPAVEGARADAPVLATVGTLDITANALFAIASTEGLVSLVSVLGSLYPLTTVALAAVVLGERPHRLAQVGVAVALTGVVLIAAGERRRPLPSVSMSLPWAEPFAAALALRHEPGLVLLESMPGFGALGRRSYLAARPAEVATDGIAALERQTTAGGRAGSPMTSAARSSALPDRGRDDLGLPPLALGRFEAWLEFDHARRTVTVHGEGDAAHLLGALRAAGQPMHRSTRPWRAGTAHCRAPTTRRRYSARSTTSARATCSRSTSRSGSARRGTATPSPCTHACATKAPRPFAALVRLGGADVISASPERFLSPPRRR